jgi:hypothetical protein
MANAFDARSRVLFIAIPEVRIGARRSSSSCDTRCPSGIVNRSRSRYGNWASAAAAAAARVRYIRSAAWSRTCDTSRASVLTPGSNTRCRRSHAIDWVNNASAPWNTPTPTPGGMAIRWTGPALPPDLEGRIGSSGCGRPSGCVRGRAPPARTATGHLPNRAPAPALRTTVAPSDQPAVRGPGALRGCIPTGASIWLRNPTPPDHGSCGSARRCHGCRWCFCATLAEHWPTSTTVVGADLIHTSGDLTAGQRGDKPYPMCLGD